MHANEAAVRPDLDREYDDHSDHEDQDAHDNHDDHAIYGKNDKFTMEAAMEGEN